MISQTRSGGGAGSMHTTVNISRDMSLIPADMGQIVNMLNIHAHSNPMIAAEVQDVMQRFQVTEHADALLAEMRERLQGRESIYDREMIRQDEHVTSQPEQPSITANTSSGQAAEQIEDTIVVAAEEGDRNEEGSMGEEGKQAHEEAKEQSNQSHMEEEDTEIDETEDTDDTEWEDVYEEQDEEEAAKSQVPPTLPPDTIDAKASNDPNKEREESRKLDIFLLSKPTSAYSGPEIFGEEILSTVRKIGLLLTAKMAPEMCKIALSNLAATFLAVSHLLLIIACLKLQLICFLLCRLKSFTMHCLCAIMRWS
ncbi:hypothetical protein EON65_41265 [archaeon]|nr:MAG: hypothetical protein EON65_41265 [archaeon]